MWPIGSGSFGKGGRLAAVKTTMTISKHTTGTSIDIGNISSFPLLERDRFLHIIFYALTTAQICLIYLNFSDQLSPNLCPGKKIINIQVLNNRITALMSRGKDVTSK